MEKKISTRVLLSPLDWGLGHATRCIPIIKALLQANCAVYVACNQTAKRILQPEFPNLTFLYLAGYDIRYASSKRWFALKILQQIPKILRAINREHRWLKAAVQEHNINLIISDNRYGLHHSSIPSIFITHQLLIQTPFRWLSQIVQKINYRFISRFSECWVPDYDGDANIAGALSHPKKLPSSPLTFIGPLSRFSKQQETGIKYNWLLLLSGPEPQRTVLEDVLVKKFSVVEGSIFFVRGLPAATESIEVPGHFTVFNHLSTEQLSQAFAQSEYIVCRSGYTSVMEIIAMQKKSLLIPTPGQTEQEYLAKHLAKQHWCFACETPELLHHSLQKISSFDYRLPQLPDVLLQTIINKTVERYSC